ncbi:mitochondrial import receptor subunit TOM40-1-like [Bidens hawaiensis]|uniref:mitochondrial import receptor subunit TOM40-1-like n=1 Tax=Bidens hawaiensis TaxID=980011 RepID=UPI00404A7F8A
MATPVDAPAPSPMPEVIKPQNTDYMKLPCPVPYDEIHREAIMSLKAEHFEGMRFDFIMGLNHRFSLTHSILMGPTEIPYKSAETIKVPTAHYDFGANFIDPRLILLGRVMTDGRVNGGVRCDLSENLTMRANAQLTSEPGMSQGLFNFDYKGSDYRTQLKFGNGALLGASYFQSMTPRLSLGGEVSYDGEHRKSDVGYAARYNTDKMVAAGQFASTGNVALSYVQKVSKKCRIRGKIDSNGCISAFLEEKLNVGLKFILSAELDHKKKDYKFGFGLTAGE